MAGVRVARSIKLDDGLTLVPEVRLGWSHEVLNDRSSVVASLAAGGGSFTVSGARPGADAALAGAGVKAQLTNSLDLFADYNGRFSDGARDHDFTVGVKYRFE